MKPGIASLLLMILLASCGSSNQNDKKIIGKWDGVVWMIAGQPSKNDALDTHFSFDDKGNYEYDYAGNKESGTYKVENDMLFTKPINESEIMVKIARLTDDSLVFDMNRGGQNESLVLMRHK
ncbi:MAG TPA: lipocalin family protein [Ferruginibacter sp.]|nr:lipocalin family protein [Ferruginibacter sp.]